MSVWGQTRFGHKETLKLMCVFVCRSVVPSSSRKNSSQQNVTVPDLRQGTKSHSKQCFNITAL